MACAPPPVTSSDRLQAGAELAHLRALVARLRDEVARLRAELARRCPPRRRSAKAGRNAAICRLRADGCRHKAIARRFGMTPEAVRQVCRRGRQKSVTLA
jgi:hypothetical protein